MANSGLRLSSFSMTASFASENFDFLMWQRVGRLAYKDLQEDDRQRLDDSIIHTTIFKQDQPEGDRSSVYEVFERINTGGVKLSAQEIRACVSHGSFISLLRELNANVDWRNIYGPPSDRLKDQELILRFFALSFEVQKYKRPMRKFLNTFLDDNEDLTPQKQKQFRILFESTISVVSKTLGTSAFRPEKQLNQLFSIPS